MTKQNLYLVQYDDKSCKQKPNGSVIGQIKKRVQGSEPKFVTIEQLKRIVESGVSFSPGILQYGLKAENWVKQQIFCVDIDNDEANAPIMPIDEAMQICISNGIEPLLYYRSFSDTSEKPKFRLVFAMDEIITNPSKREFIAKTLVSLFPQADKSCVNADRIFFGTNKEVQMNGNEIGFDKIVDIHLSKKVNLTGELGTQIQRYDFEGFLRKELGGNIMSENQDTIKFKKCPICGHNDCFVYYKDTKSFFCFGKHGNRGGSIIDYLMYTKALDKKQALEYFLYKLCDLPRIDKFTSGKQVFDVISAQDLINANIPDPYCCIENLIYQGITILAAPPKYGKSWMSMDMCISVAKGDDFLGFKTQQSGTLYLALEDSKSRAQKRLKKLICGSEVPKDFYITTDTITIDTGLINTLEDYLQKNPNIKLIVVDTLQKIRGNNSKSQNIYAKDYSDIGQLKSFADKHKLCVIIVHHLRKASKKDDDVFNQISGTNGILGAADTALVLKKMKRDNNDGILNICGRDVENEELNVVFDNRTCKWISLGNAEIQENKRQLKEYSDNETIMVIRNMLNIENHWEGTIKELKEFLEDKYACTLKESEAIIAKTLKKYKDLMFKEDEIDYIPAPPNGSNGKRIHRFKKCSLFSFMENSEDIDDLFL